MEPLQRRVVAFLDQRHRLLGHVVFVSLAQKGTLVQRVEHTSIPARRSHTCITIKDSQSSMEIAVLQGNRTMAAYNHTTGLIVLRGIRPAPRAYSGLIRPLAYAVECARHQAPMPNSASAFAVVASATSVRLIPLTSASLAATRRT